MANDTSATPNRILAGLIVLTTLAIVVVGGVILRDLVLVPEVPRTAIERDLETAKAALRAKPRDPEAHADLGSVYFRMEDYEAAKTEFKQAIRLNGMYLVARFNLAMVYKAQGKNDEAVAELNGLLKKYPADDLALFRLGELYLQQKKYRSAISAFERSIKSNPVLSDTHFELAATYEKVGKRALAIREYREVLRYVPDHAGARKALARLSKKKARK